MAIKERTDLKDIVKLLRCIQRHPEGTYRNMAVELDISESTVKRMRKRVKSLGVVIENTGSRIIPYYVITAWGVISKNEVTQESA